MGLSVMAKGVCTCSMKSTSRMSDAVPEYVYVAKSWECEPGSGSEKSYL